MRERSIFQLFRTFLTIHVLLHHSRRNPVDRIEALEAWRIDKQRQRNTKSAFDLAPRLYGKCGWNVCAVQISQVCKGFFLYFITLGNQSGKFITLIFIFYTIATLFYCTNIFPNHIYLINYFYSNMFMKYFKPV